MAGGVLVGGGMCARGVCVVGGGMHGRGHAWQGACMTGGAWWGGHAWQILQDTVNEWAVCILLECILFGTFFWKVDGSCVHIC